MDLNGEKKRGVWNLGWIRHLGVHAWDSLLGRAIQGKPSWGTILVFWVFSLPSQHLTAPAPQAELSIPQNPTGVPNVDLWDAVSGAGGGIPFPRVSWSREGCAGGEHHIPGEKGGWDAHSRSCSCPQDVLTLSSSTDSDGENGQAPGRANDSDDIQTISSGSEEEEGEDKKNPSSGSGEGGDEG